MKNLLRKIDAVEEYSPLGLVVLGAVAVGVGWLVSVLLFVI